MKEYNATWEYKTGRPDLVWNSLENYFIWILKKVKKVGGMFQIEGAAWAERVFLVLEIEIKQVWKISDEVVNSQDPNLMLFSKKFNKLFSAYPPWGSV